MHHVLALLVLHAPIDWSRCLRLELRISAKSESRLDGMALDQLTLSLELLSLDCIPVNQVVVNIHCAPISKG